MQIRLSHETISMGETSLSIATKITYVGDLIEKSEYLIVILLELC